MKKKMLLHVCCAPCSTSVLERLKAEEDFNITIFFSNSNILPIEEYEKRKQTLIEFIEKVHPEIEIIFDDYNPAEFFKAIKGTETMGEGSIRCTNCISYRLEKTAKKAKELNYDIFATTLTVSPHKNAKLINEIGNKLSTEFNIDYYESDFKKRDGYKRSIELCKQYNIYRQNYCGCNLDKRGNLWNLYLK